MKFFLQLLQYSSINPSWHPPGHTPLIRSHGFLFSQKPLHRCLQLIPKWPGIHSERNAKQHKYIIIYYMFSCFINVLSSKKWIYFVLSPNSMWMWKILRRVSKYLCDSHYLYIPVYTRCHRDRFVCYMESCSDNDHCNCWYSHYHRYR